MIFDHKPNIPAGSFHLFRDIVRPGGFGGSYFHPSML